MPAWFFEKKECTFCGLPEARTGVQIGNPKGQYICKPGVWSLAQSLAERPYQPLRSPRQTSSGTTAVPTLDDLLRVIVIGQAVTQAGVTAKLHALEIYADGFAVSGRVRPTAPSEAAAVDPRVHWSFVLHPSTALTIDDGLGRHYVPGGGSSGSGSREEYRFRQAFGPALSSDVRQVRIEIASLHWVRFDLRAPNDRSRDVPVPGPWVFIVPLGPA